MDREKKFQHIYDLASFLQKHAMTIPVPLLAEYLNHNRFTTRYGAKHEGKRGSYTLIESVYRWVYDKYGSEEAAKVALSFTLPNGGYAYEKASSGEAAA